MGRAMDFFYSTKDVALKLSVSANTVKNMCIRGDLPYTTLKVGGKTRYFIPVEGLNKLLEKNFVPVKPVNDVLKFKRGRR